MERIIKIDNRMPGQGFFLSGVIGGGSPAVFPAKSTAEPDDPCMPRETD
jgi:hypothetical protein